MKNYIFKATAMLLLSLISFNNMNAQTTSNTNQALNAHQQSMVRIVAFTSVGNIDQLKTELATGLEVGMTVNEIKEALVQLYAYCGFPRSLNALNTFMTVVEERKSKGIKDVVGRDASPIVDTTNKYETGKQTL
jgi:4-carboxymuconolactone decarboxylase